jgi:outer membrane protein OmpA-like peptidoglycan-associated protein
MYFSRLLALFCLYLLSLQPLSAQPIPKQVTALFAQKKYSEALPLLQKILETQATDRAALRMAGVCAFQLNDLAQAKSFFTPLIENNSDASVAWYLGRIAQYEMRWKDAIGYYKNFLRLCKADDPERRGVVADIARCGYAQKIVLQPELALVENLGANINSSADEMMPIQSPNNEEKIYFSANRDGSEGGLRNEQGIADEKNGVRTNDIFSSSNENGEWSTPEALNNTLINTTRQEVVLDFAQQGKVMLFFRGFTRFSGEVLVDTFKTSDEIRTLIPKFDAPILGEMGDNSLYVFRDSIIIFSSRRKDGFGGSDLYFTRRQTDNSWTTPENLGDKINTPFDETSPFLSHDGRTLYFSSNNLHTLGGFDIFKALFNEDSLTFDAPVNLGKGINSAGDEIGFRLTTDGQKAYFSSNRKEGLGGFDLYFALFKKTQLEQIATATPYFWGDVALWKANGWLKTDDQPKTPVITELKLQPFYYDTDEDLTRGVNLQQLKKIVEIAKQFPSTRFHFTAHSIEGDRLTLDLYLASKRVDLLAKYLTDNGLPPEQIVLKSVGSNFPIALTMIDGSLNVAGEKVNRRIDVAISGIGESPLKFTFEPPVVSPFMVNPSGNRLAILYKGLSYKIQVVSSKRIYEGDILTKSGDAMIEKTSDGTLQYSVGLYQKYSEAEQARREILKTGQKTAEVVPYLDGVRLSYDDARRWSNRYGDLLNFLASRKP